MRHTRSFTLIEILVVIAIIGILAGLIFPALNRARAVSQATQCINNKRSIGQTVNVYALNYDKRIPLTMNGKPYSWYFRGYCHDQSDAKNERPNGQVYMSFPTMRCPLTRVPANEEYPEKHVSAIFDTGDPGSGSSGWWGQKVSSSGSRTKKDRFGDFYLNQKKVPKMGSSDVDYSLRLLRDTSGLALFADAFIVEEGKNPLTDGTTWKFDYKGSSSDDGGRIALLHQDKAVIGYADGHADQRDKSELENMGFSNFYSAGFKDAK